ncbi:MAG: hypothetical protein AAF456_18225 [Planctomycetota bacterium]
MPEKESTSRADVRKLRNTVLLVSRVVVACGLMVWGAMNLATNVRGLMAEGLEAGLFSTVGLSMVALILVTAVLPIAIGVFLLMRFDAGVRAAAANRAVRNSKKDEEEPRD